MINFYHYLNCKVATHTGKQTDEKRTMLFFIIYSKHFFVNNPAYIYAELSEYIFLNLITTGKLFYIDSKKIIRKKSPFCKLLTVMILPICVNIKSTN